MPKTIIFDTETTDKNNPIIIEAAWLEVAGFEPFTTGLSWVQRYNPGKPISLGALATHHIMDEELADCPPSSSFLLPSDCEYIIGHNIDFDWSAVGCPDVKRVCTLALSRRLWPNIDSHNQSALVYYLERALARELLKNAHSALADVMICSLIVSHICGALGVGSVEDLYRESELARIPTVMPFGKHKGQLLADVPGDYRDWLLNQADIDPYLRKALEL
jgi:exodeoxyribonuclease X